MTVRLQAVKQRTCPACGGAFPPTIDYCPKDGTALSGGHADLATAGTDMNLGRVIDGKYRVDTLLGTGGMGVVYSATHARLGKRVAVKVLRPELSQEADIISRFTQEARAASAIGSEHITDVTDFGELSDGSAYFVMEFLDGAPLSAPLKNGGRIAPERAVSIMAQLCKALGAAHAQGIVHRDLKPDNIFLVRRGDRDDFVKVLDFGIAKVAGAASPRTRSGMIFGTPHYMSPEQAAGGELDQRTDVYSAGVILFRMLVGAVPFASESFMGILSKHMFEAPRTLAQVFPDPTRPAAFEAIVARALEKKPQARYQSMEELRLALLTAVPTAATDLGTAPPLPLSPAEWHEAATLRPGRRPAKGTWRLWVAGGIGLSLVLIVALGVGLGMRGREHPTLTGTSLPPQAVPTLTQAPEVVPTPRSQGAPQEVPAPPVLSATIVIRSEPPGAEVREGETLLGVTPLTIDRPTGGARTLSVRAPLLIPTTVELAPNSSETLTVALVRASRPSQSSGPRTQSGGGELHDPFGP